ncbi:MAG: mechanosensitive ion channel family protein [Gammaproteobacteria bacterium]
MDNFINLVKQVWQQGLLGINLTDIIVCLFILFFAVLVRGIFISKVITIVLKLLHRSVDAQEDIFTDVKKPLAFIPITLALYVIFVYLPFEGLANEIATKLIRAVIAFTIFNVLANLIPPIFRILSSTSLLTESMSIWIQRAAKLVIWIVGLGIILDIFGIQIGPLVAGLGIFSVAVALGAQELFKNLIAGLLIIGENRFQPGDRIEVSGQLHGVVEKIGFRSTQIRLFDTSPMIIPNKDLSDFQLINHGNMDFRKVDWIINLLYSTTKDQLVKITKDITTFINSGQFIQNPNQASFAKIVALGASSIDVRIICFANAGMSFGDYMSLKEELILKIIEIVRSNGSEFAYPSTSLYVEQLPSK